MVIEVARNPNLIGRTVRFCAKVKEQSGQTVLLSLYYRWGHCTRWMHQILTVWVGLLCAFLNTCRLPRAAVLGHSFTRCIDNLIWNGVQNSHLQATTYQHRPSVWTRISWPLTSGSQLLLRIIHPMIIWGIKGAFWAKCIFKLNVMECFWNLGGWLIDWVGLNI